MRKYYLILIIGIIITLVIIVNYDSLLLIGSAESPAFDYNNKDFKPAEVKANQVPKSYKDISLYPESATSTEKIRVPEKYILSLVPKYEGQGLCILIRNADGRGNSYLTVQDGVASFSKISCE